MKIGNTELSDWKTLCSKDPAFRRFDSDQFEYLTSYVTTSYIKSDKVWYVNFFW